MYIPTPVIGLGAFVLGVLLTLFLPLGRARSNHTVSMGVIFVLFAFAGLALLPAVFGLGVGVSLAIGAGVGVLAVLYRGLRRGLRYFQGAVYRATHPYYWYGRMWRSATKSRRRRRR